MAAFLTGTLTDRCDAEGLAVPTWAWTLGAQVIAPAQLLVDLLLKMTDEVSLSDLQESILFRLELGFPD